MDRDEKVSTVTSLSDLPLRGQRSKSRPSCVPCFCMASVNLSFVYFVAPCNEPRSLRGQRSKNQGQVLGVNFYKRQVWGPSCFDMFTWLVTRRPEGLLVLSFMDSFCQSA